MPIYQGHPARIVPMEEQIRTGVNAIRALPGRYQLVAMPALIASLANTPIWEKGLQGLLHAQSARWGHTLIKMVCLSARPALRQTSRLKLFPERMPICREHLASIVPLEEQISTAVNVIRALPGKYHLVGLRALRVQQDKAQLVHLRLA